MNDTSLRDMTDAFGFVFLLSRRFEYITDQVLAQDGLTTKQLLTLIAIEEGFETLPSITQVAEVLSTTHQNIKKIALQLKKKGFVEIVKDEQDKRRSLLKTTKKSKDYWDSRAQEHMRAIQSLFESLSNDEIHTFNILLKKLVKSVEIPHKDARE